MTTWSGSATITGVAAVLLPVFGTSPFVGRPAVQEDLADDAQHRRQMARVINQLQAGHDNTSLKLTLVANAPSTTVTDSRISMQTYLTFMPTTANAAAELPTLYATCSKGQAVVYHTNNSAVDRTYTIGLRG